MPLPAEESWRGVVGFADLYEVSDAGRVRRMGRAAKAGRGRGGGVRLGRVLTGVVNRGGYASVQLWRDGRVANKLVHVLVAEAFIGPRPHRLDVNHIDGNKRNNAAVNLEYCTRGENNAHAFRLGLRSATRGPSPRRKPRIEVGCACGCGLTIVTPDKKGRERRYAYGHWRKAA
jgi:hypothetical protein